MSHRVLLRDSEKRRCEEFNASLGLPPCWMVAEEDDDWPEDQDVYVCMDCSDVNND